MKSKKSFFNATVFRKDITRFAPLWALYLIGGMLFMLNLTDSHNYNSAARTLGTSLSLLPTINFVYAALSAFLLFGDLFKGRLCNALHAMPLRREAWFVTHSISGLAFSLVPNTLLAVIIMPRLGSFWFVGLLWLLGVTLQYLFFFGVAVFSSLCAGNKVGAAAVYAILNFGSLVVLWFVTAIYQPMMYGVEISEDIFTFLCPVYQMTGASKYFAFHYTDGGRYFAYNGLGSIWLYMAVAAGIGLVLGLLALLLYRRRKLEAAGDFIAVPAIAPVFAVVFALCSGAFFSLFGQLFANEIAIYLLIGICVGWFAGQMLLKRTVKVFQGKSFLKLGILVAVMIASILLVKFDVFGVVSWTPDADDVASISLSTRYSAHSYSEYEIIAEDESEIQFLIDLHKESITNGDEELPGQARLPLYFEYRLKNGTTVRRQYLSPVSGSSKDTLRHIFSDPVLVLGTADWRGDLDSVELIDVDGVKLPQNTYEGLLAAMEADCLDGNMAYHSALHSSNSNVRTWITLVWASSDGTEHYREIRIYPDAKNTINWLSQHKDLFII